MRTVYEFSVKDRKGKAFSLKEFSNEVLLIVNTATKMWFHTNLRAVGGTLREVPCTKDLKYLISLATSLDSKHQVPTRVFTSFANLLMAPNSHVSKKIKVKWR